MNIPHVLECKCSVCGDSYTSKYAGQSYVCSKGHGEDKNDGNLNVVYDYKLIKKNIEENGLLPWTKGHFRYLPFMPLPKDAKLPPLVVGNTPLYESPDLAKDLGVGSVYIKDDGRNPTASLKDRASSLLVAICRAENRDIITTASTGNAAAALAGCAASLNQDCVIFVPAAAPPAKISQMLVYGATVLLVDGTYDDAFALCLEASKSFGWYCRNTGYNAFTAEGKKTVSIELCEQLAMILDPVYEACQDPKKPKFVAPDNIFVSVGDGNIITGVYKGLRDLVEMGYISKMPTLFGIQSEGSNFCSEAWKNKVDPLMKKPIVSTTCADSIAAGLPRDRVNAVNAVSETKGAFIEVTDEEILSAIPYLARSTGVFGEPAASTAIAGLKKASEKKMISPDSSNAVIITGNGLKDVAAVKNALDLPSVDSKSATIPVNADAMVDAVHRLFPKN